ncbi:MAG: NUDIX hydrolase, partial [Actinomycetota bacterium]|nr:NUDIX hydrolase [Actinomycetota bacterium]
MSEGERAKPRRRRGRRRGRRSAGPPEAGTPSTASPSSAPLPGPTPGHQVDASAQAPASRSGRRSPERLRTVHETSAGGLVIDGIDG